jgi:broad specificity phosphatase PhoE
MPTLLLVRHGQASFGAADYDVLSEQGHAQAALLTAELERQGLSIGSVTAGSMRRQRETAQPIAAFAGVPVGHDDRLDEFSAEDVLGTYSTSGARLTGTQTLSSRGFQEALDPALDAWMAAGDDGSAEVSWPAFSRRGVAALADAGAALGAGETGVLCTSAGVIAAACVQLLGLPDAAFVALNRVAVNGAVTKVAVGRRGMSLVSFNAHAYLTSPTRSLVTYR